MTDTLPTPPQPVEAAASMATAPVPGPLSEWRSELGTALIGQPAVIEALLIALLAGGHVLIEGPPGTGKRLAARVLAASFGARFSQVPCLPGLSAAALLPTVPDAAAEPDGQVLLVHGLEQASLATQAALSGALQAVEEAPGELPPQPRPPFMLVASRNPAESTGVIALSDALLDRFLLAVPVPWPGQDDEARLARELSAAGAPDMLPIAPPQPLFTAASVAALQLQRGAITADKAVVDYAVRLVRATRFSAQLSHGAGPRASVALVRCAQARALLNGQSYASAADVKACAPAVLRHRVGLTMAQRLQGAAIDHVLNDVLEHVSAPRP